MNARIINSPVGELFIIANNSAVTGLYFADQEPSAHENVKLDINQCQVLDLAQKELSAYFKGKLKKFSVPIEFTTPYKTPFRLKIWHELLKIPYGETISYGELARLIGNPKAARAVGGANNKNPISIIVPCHRVIGANGKLVGFGGGLEKKLALLELERKYKT